MVILELIGLFLLMIIQVIIPPIPAEILVLFAVKKYGIFITTLFAGSGLFVGSVIVYFLGFYLRSKTEKYFKSNKSKIIETKLKKYGNFILLIRLFPSNPSDIISYIAGLLKFEKKSYLIITFFVTFIRVFLLAMLGTYIENISSLIFIISIIALTGILSYAFIIKK